MTKEAVVVGLMVPTLMLSGCRGSVEETMTPEVEADYVPVIFVTGEVVPTK